MGTVKNSASCPWSLFRSIAISHLFQRDKCNYFYVCREKFSNGAGYYFHVEKINKIDTENSKDGTITFKVVSYILYTAKGRYSSLFNRNDL